MQPEIPKGKWPPSRPNVVALCSWWAFIIHILIVKKFQIFRLKFLLPCAHDHLQVSVRSRTRLKNLLLFAVSIETKNGIFTAKRLSHHMIISIKFQNHKKNVERNQFKWNIIWSSNYQNYGAKVRNENLIHLLVILMRKITHDVCFLLIK